MKEYIREYRETLPGIFFVCMFAFFSKFISIYVFIGSIATSIIIGALINNIFSIHSTLDSGISFCEKKILNLSIILMGAHLNISILQSLSSKIIIIIFCFICFAIISTYILGKCFNLSPSLSILLGFGNGICGSSAIAGASSIIDSEKEDIGLSISIINILGAMGIFLVPWIINSLNIDSINSQGIIIGGTIQAVGQVTAAGFIMGDEVGELATIVKMVRILMLGPFLIILSILFNRKNNQSSKLSYIKIPPFIIGFIVMALFVNLKIIPSFIIPYLNILSKYFLLFAMTAIGLKISISSIYNKGIKVFYVSLITFLIQIFLYIHFVT